jgi:hypothetical protein
MQGYYNFIDVVEKMLTPIGFMEGQTAVPKRMLLGGILGAGVVALIKPTSMFSNGVARPWTFLASAKDEGGIKPTSTPWLIGPFLGAVFLGLFV